MTKRSKFLLSVLSILVILGTLLLPMSVLAKGEGRSREASVTIAVPWDAHRPYQAKVGRVRVVILPGTLPEPEGGSEYLFTLSVQEKGNAFIADLTLEPPVETFRRPVLAKFGSADVVYYCPDADCAAGEGEPIPTRGGWAMLDHFSRYSGWY
ncbi:MAG: hypothetical protein H5T69_02655 [Chloroflexi bacterium]|nr:hypothetical protein [Chloroflexota bacterium]